MKLKKGNKIKKEEENPFKDNGLYFGYPECCIESFWNMLNGSRLSKPDHNKKLCGTGYVPCNECDKKPEEELINIIKKNRKCEVPFPESGVINNVPID